MPGPALGSSLWVTPFGTIIPGWAPLPSSSIYLLPGRRPAGTLALTLARSRQLLIFSLTLSPRCVIVPPKVCAVPSYSPSKPQNSQIGRACDVAELSHQR
ncbi:hypothetical protein BJX63DRAFT_320889 [Aspergillus granulosus]|uniref:Uncharacterized protein n=1 Tax=Aspergillus granulosus TaxID=176169 RepID=A0ABR4H698_9EURO